MKKSKQSSIKNKYFWIAISFLIVGLFLWNFTETNRQENLKSENYLNQTIEEKEIDINTPLGNDSSKEQIVVEKSSENIPLKESQKTITKESGKHVTPEKEIVIDLPGPPSGTDNELPSHFKLLKIGDIDEAIRNLVELKAEIELMLEKTPSDEKLAKDLVDVQNEIKKLTIEREKIVNGDF